MNATAVEAMETGDVSLGPTFRLLPRRVYDVPAHVDKCSPRAVVERVQREAIVTLTHLIYRDRGRRVNIGGGGSGGSPPHLPSLSAGERLVQEIYDFLDP